MLNELYALHKDSVKVISECIKSKNENVKLKAAFRLIERIDAQKIGEANPRKTIEQECTSSGLMTDWGITFNKDKYNRLCFYNGLNPLTKV